MADLALAHNIPHHAHAVAPVINQGISMLTLAISNLVTAGIAGGLAWYIRGRGMTGVQNDINNIKTEIEKLKTGVTAGVTAAQTVA